MPAYLEAIENTRGIIEKYPIPPNNQNVTIDDIEILSQNYKKINNEMQWIMITHEYELYLEKLLLCQVGFIQACLQKEFTNNDSIHTKLLMGSPKTNDKDPNITHTNKTLTDIWFIISASILEKTKSHPDPKIIFATHELLGYAQEFLDPYAVFVFEMALDGISIVPNPEKLEGIEAMKEQLDIARAQFDNENRNRIRKWNGYRTPGEQQYLDTWKLSAQCTILNLDERAYEYTDWWGLYQKEIQKLPAKLTQEDRKKIIPLLDKLVTITQQLEEYGVNGEYREQILNEKILYLEQLSQLHRVDWDPLIKIGIQRKKTDALAWAYIEKKWREMKWEQDIPESDTEAHARYIRERREHEARWKGIQFLEANARENVMWKSAIEIWITASKKNNQDPLLLLWDLTQLESALRKVFPLPPPYTPIGPNMTRFIWIILEQAKQNTSITPK